MTDKKFHNLLLQVGNYLVSTRDLNPLDVILRDCALPSGPQHDPTPVCLTCYTKIDPKDFVQCPGTDVIKLFADVIYECSQ